MGYDNLPPMPDKYLMPDGSIVTWGNVEVAPPDEERAQLYNRMQLVPAKWLLPDGSVVSALPFSGGGEGGGNVNGPASAVNNNITVFDQTTGKKIKDSGISISDINRIASAMQLGSIKVGNNLRIAVDGTMSVVGIPSYEGEWNSSLGEF